MFRKIIFMLMFLPVLSFADTPRGERLVQQLWNNIQAKRIEKIKEHMSKDFQALDQNGTVLNRYEEVTQIENTIMQSHTLGNIQTTQGENIIVVTYTLDAMEMIDGESTEVTGPLLSVWKKCDGEWKWVAHTDNTSYKHVGPF
jgi:ketosteroid isomerase-like protein